MTKRETRISLIRSFVQSGHIKTQSELVDLLAEQGIEATQATISRDIAEMGLQKKDGGGYYVLPEDAFVRRMVKELVREVVPAQNLVVVKASTGAAQGVAAALDGAELKGIIGSIAGDDTIMLIAADNEGAVKLAATIDSFRS
ncbi:MAG: ArgR family transcriptional regulator [Coriobacteriia bacterium]|nr:ArgR family transcriptional regulator [Coriobacteriia bacterium]MCL2750946.1 ArgR family transcriptional regulator [Coriobacteriia bacterium]